MTVKLWPLLLLVGCAVSPTRADSADITERVTIRIDAPADWSGETIALPPGFARDMKLVGVEGIRFAPGMFQPDSDTFFTYAFIFWLPESKPLDEKTIHTELLTYYRGLARAVARDEKLDPAPDDFQLDLKAVAAAKPGSAKPSPTKPADTKPADTKPDDQSAIRSDASDPAAAAHPPAWRGTLRWSEPFRTKTAQTLHFEIVSRPAADRSAAVLSVAASPRPFDDEIWARLRAMLERATITPRPATPDKNQRIVPDHR